MKKILMGSLFFFALFTFSACGPAEEINPVNTVDGVDNQACSSICATAMEKCSTLTEDACLEQCQNGSNLEKACLQNFQNCQELATDCRQPGEETASDNADNNCVMACNNYVSKCISLVPGAGQAMETDAYNSCMGECAKWDNSKIDCMSIAPSCESFTNQCGL